ncbi:hypothetical protein, partial [Desulfoluna sp.]|uniref:hypothetical protein n=1 Tax=Desulfoluna sp. TaxID=2045199 RepID=UPI00260D094E
CMRCRWTEFNSAVNFNRNNSGGKVSHLENGVANAHRESSFRAEIRPHSLEVQGNSQYVASA